MGNASCLKAGGRMSPPRHAGRSACSRSEHAGWGVALTKGLGKESAGARRGGSRAHGGAAKSANLHRKILDHRTDIRYTTNMCSEGGARGSWTSGEVFQEINSLLNRLQSEDINSMPAQPIGNDQTALQRIVNRVQAEGLRRLRRFDSGQGYAPSGALSARAWLRWQLNLTANAAAERAGIRRKLAALPQTDWAPA